MTEQPEPKDEFPEKLWAFTPMGQALVTPPPTFYMKHWSQFYAAMKVRDENNMPKDQQFIVHEVFIVQMEVCPECKGENGGHSRGCNAPSKTRTINLN